MSSLKKRRLYFIVFFVMRLNPLFSSFVVYYKTSFSLVSCSSYIVLPIVYLRLNFLAVVL